MAERKKMSGEDTTEKVVKTTVEVLDTTIKYRSDFKSWEEYYTYKGVKG
jgi:hypothetical protein